MEEAPVALVINAGGQSRRMGRAKALLPIPPDDTPLIVHILYRLVPLVTDRVIIVSNDPQVADVLSAPIDCFVMPDKWADGGALGGVATGLGACGGWAMVVACDMPLVDPALFGKLIDVARMRPELDAVIPLINGAGQPFHGLWHSRALPLLAARLAKDELEVQGALRALNVVWMDEGMLGIEADHFAFYNVNTPSEWEEFLAILADQKGR